MAADWQVAAAVTAGSIVLSLALLLLMNPLDGRLVFGVAARQVCRCRVGARSPYFWRHSSFAAQQRALDRRYDVAERLGAMAQPPDPVPTAGSAAPFAAAFLMLVVVLALLGHFGLPDAVLGTFSAARRWSTFTAIGINASTMQTSEFYLAARSVPAPVNGVAGAAAVMSGAIFLGLAGTHFADVTSRRGRSRLGSVSAS